MAKNTNCLRDMRCPKCRDLESFLIACRAMFEVHDDGTEVAKGATVEWENDSTCVCKGCGFVGVVGDFKLVNQKKKGT